MRTHLITFFPKYLLRYYTICKTYINWFCLFCLFQSIQFVNIIHLLSLMVTQCSPIIWFQCPTLLANFVAGFFFGLYYPSICGIRPCIQMGISGHVNGSQVRGWISVGYVHGLRSPDRAYSIQYIYIYMVIDFSSDHLAGQSSALSSIASVFHATWMIHPLDGFENSGRETSVYCRYWLPAESRGTWLWLEKCII